MPRTGVAPFCCAAPDALFALRACLRTCCGVAKCTSAAGAVSSEERRNCHIISKAGNVGLGRVCVVHIRLCPGLNLQRSTSLQHSYQQQARASRLLSRHNVPAATDASHFRLCSRPLKAASCNPPVLTFSCKRDEYLLHARQTARNLNA